MWVGLILQRSSSASYKQASQSGKIMANPKLLLLALAFLPFAIASTSKPNIILFVIDDLGWNDTSYQGAEYSTPNIDKLAEEGIRLKQYYVQPLCSPSRSALMAGRYPYHLGLAHGVITNGHPFALSSDEVTIADRLRKGGYATHAVGKWDLGMHKWEYTPTYRGFDTFYGYYDADEDYLTHSVGGEAYRDPNDPKKMIHPHGVDFRDNKDPVTDQNGTYSTNLFTEAIQKAIVSHTEDKKPFFIYGAYQSVHGPLEAPNKYLEKCLTSRITEANRKIFCGMMQALDEGIGNITKTLEEKELLDNTVILLSTDNGGQTALGSHNWPLRGNKATVFEGGVRGIGFVWSKKLSKTDFDYTGLMHITDWYRTIVEGIAGLTLSSEDTAHLDGINMWEGITQNGASDRDEILHQLDPPNYTNPKNPFVGQAALRSGEWKLIVGQPSCSANFSVKCPTGWVHLNGTIESPPDNPHQTWLFNVIDDPHERNDVAKSNPDIVARLYKRIQTFNSTHIEQMRPPFDPRSDPQHFGGVWTPWMD